MIWGCRNHTQLTYTSELLHPAVLRSHGISPNLCCEAKPLLWASAPWCGTKKKTKETGKQPGFGGVGKLPGVKSHLDCVDEVTSRFGLSTHRTYPSLAWTLTPDRCIWTRFGVYGFLGGIHRPCLLYQFYTWVVYTRDGLESPGCTP